MVDWDALVLGPVHGVFAEPVVYLPKGGSPTTTEGIFDEAYREVDLAGGMAVTTETPVLGIRLSAFPQTPQQDDQITVGRTGVTYVIRETQLDGHGAAKLLLNKVSA
ncbi:hypothetical protein [Variovorax sp. PAMC26660]|uniref:head-tail joining protein n=1 Tax=Variovorax sp. PAMC26660 TaxID=2762322 RepID=UPI0021C4AEC2|nr:hypothetical protein [Variovorax sp. PAMC26660]